jgi:hypothetical protein
MSKKYKELIIINMNNFIKSFLKLLDPLINTRYLKELQKITQFITLFGMKIYQEQISYIYKFKFLKLCCTACFT